MYFFEKIKILAGRLLNLFPSIIQRKLTYYMEVSINGFNDIFDAEYYSSINEDVRSSGIDPVKHYIMHGAYEGRNPSPLFDVEFYKSQVNIPDDFPFTPLTHFLLIGRKKDISPTPWFDFSYYRKNNPDVAANKICPFIHFIRFGIWRNAKASPHFDPEAYLAAHPEVPADMPALLHFLQKQVSRQRGAAWGQANYAASSLNLEHKILDILAALKKLEPCENAPDKADVHVVMPVYDGYDITLRALYSVLTSRNATPFTLTVIDDYSPDERLSQALELLSRQLGFKYVRHEENAGFVRTANEGMRLYPDKDVVLLNADTEVYHDWLDRLRAAAHSQDNVASVTPLSNNATICSYPEFLGTNFHPLELPYEELDELAARVNAKLYVEIPTGVGFCMYITRKALDQVGDFDAQAFGRGYGEENDFCMRARAAGMINLAAADTFVRHVGSVSFGAEKQARQRQAIAMMNRKHPGYDALIQQFIQRDPLRAAREKLDMARLERLRQEKNLLFLGLVRGGGAELSMTREMKQAQRRGESAFMLVPTQHGSQVRIAHFEAGPLPNLPVMDLSREKDKAVDLVTRLSIDQVIVHHLIELSADAPVFMREICEEASVPYVFHLHDYLSVCPRINLIDHNGKYCHERGIAQCKACLKDFRFNGEPVDIEQWRARYGYFLRGAARILVPSIDVRERFLSYFPDLEVKVRPPEPPVRSRVRLRDREQGEPLRIAVLGAIGFPKGVQVLEQCARVIRKKRLSLELTVIGYTSRNRALQRWGVKITGGYADTALLELIEEQDPDCIFLPSICPETYSYTLTRALQSGRPVVVFDIGAMARRVRGLPHVLVLPLHLQDKPEELLAAIQEWLRNLRGQMAGQNIEFAEADPAELLAQEKPREDYLIFFTPRSGSSYLTSLLASTHCLGNPAEFINPEWAEDVAKKKGASSVEELIFLLRAAEKKRTGVFGMEATILHVKKHGLEISESFRRLCKEAEIFVLLRKDIIYQAISLYKAVQTNIFHLAVQAGSEDIKKVDEGISYNSGDIKKWIEHIYQQEKHLANFIDEVGLKPHTLFYENIVELPPKVTARLFANILKINLNNKNCKKPLPSYKKIATKTNKEFYKKFAEENKEYIYELDERRGRVFSRIFKSSVYHIPFSGNDYK